MSKSPATARRTKAVLIALAVAGTLLTFSREPFSPSRWKSFHSNYAGFGHSPPGGYGRARMVDDLINTQLRRGMAAGECRDLLGEPETEEGGTDSRSGYYQVDGYALTYIPIFAMPLVLLRWNSPNPYPYVRYEQGKLVRAMVR